MSGKYNKKKAGRTGRKKNSGLGLKIAVAAAVVLLSLAVGLLIYLQRGQGGSETTAPHQSTTTAAQTTGNAGTTAGASEETVPTTTAPQIQIQVPEDVIIDLGNGLKIADVGSYTGIFMEDGSDEVVTGVMMILVTNESDQTLQYAEITLADGLGGEARFSLSTLSPGESVVVLEQTRMGFAEGYNYAAAQNVVYFQEEPSLHADKLKIQAYQGALNVTNISEEDITGDILIYYKNSASDVFYGGITYMVRIQGGLEAGELRQLVPSHFNASSSTVMFVVIQ